MPIEQKIKRSPRAYWEGHGRKILMIPNKNIHRLLNEQHPPANVYITDIGYYPKAKSHYVERKNGSPENIILYCADGQGWYETAGGRFNVRRNQFFILPANLQHKYASDSNNPWTLYWIMFEGDASAHLQPLQTFHHWQQPRCLPHPQKFVHLFDDTAEILSTGFSIHNLALANINLWLILTLFRLNGVTRSKDETAVEKSIAFMHDNMHRKLSVAEIASTVDYSSSHLHQLFRSAMGYSPVDYFIHLKMQQACHYLTHSNLKIYEISSLLGYDDPYFFSRTFTRTNGISPQQFRQAKS